LQNIYQKAGGKLAKKRFYLSKSREVCKKQLLFIEKQIEIALTASVTAKPQV
jgi:hypothetical protein